MKRWLVLAILVSAFAGVGCEWGSITDDISGGDDDDDDNNGVITTNGNNNTNNPTEPTETNVVGVGEVAVTSEVLGYGSVGATAYSGSMDHSPIKEGSVTIRAGGFYFSDNGDTTLEGDVPGTAGRIEYSTGAWAINLGGGDLSAGEPIVGNYVYLTELGP